MALNDLNTSSEGKEKFQAELDKLYKNYVDELDLWCEEAADEIEDAILRGQVNKQEIVTEYVQLAAQRAEDYYQEVRDIWKNYLGIDMPPLESYGLIDVNRALWKTQSKLINERYIGLRYQDALSGNNQYGITMADLWHSMENIDDAQQFIADMMRNGARLQTMHNIRNDPTQPRWARVPSGAKTCAFCMMLASRGFTYQSEEAAGIDNSYHADCDCKIIPSWGKQTLKGYDWERYHALYKKAQQEAADDNYHSVLERMRRLAPEELKDGVWETSRPWPQEEVVHIQQRIWDHIFLNHSSNSTVPNKTHWPKEWSKEKIKWATRQTVCDPEEISTSPDGMKQRRYRHIDDVYVEVYLKKYRKTKGRFQVDSAYPMNEYQRRARGK